MNLQAATIPPAPPSARILPQSPVLEAERARRASGNPTPDPTVEAARSFESFFLSQMFEYMTRGLKVSAPFGGGSAEQTWRSMLNEEYGKAMSRGGRGIGVADMVYGEMLRIQEASAAAAGTKRDASPNPYSNIVPN